MYSLTSYVAGALAVLLAADYLAPSGSAVLAPDGRAMAVSIAPAPAGIASMTMVNRENKGDRLMLKNPVRMLPANPAAKPPKILVGCDPAFSPLSVSARLLNNYSRRCIA